MKLSLSVLACCLMPFCATAADQLQIAVTHDLEIARPSETITVPWAEVSKAIPRALLQKIAVIDPSGRSIPYQVTNVAPQAKDPEGKGAAYGDLIFQHDFAAGEKSASFTVQRIDTVAPVFPVRAFARYVPERLDDFAWENDRIGHRTYGPALAAPRQPGSNKEVLVSSGLDIWCKRVSYPIVDRWYNKGHDHYHTDQGEGMDMYQVGQSRGCGGTGIWDGQTLHVARNYQTWRILANGPIRAIFELTYEPWDANGIKVAETKRFTVDAGHNLDLIESTFTVTEGEAKELTVAIGLNKNSADRGQDAKFAVSFDKSNGALTQWIAQKSNGELGTAILVPNDSFRDFAADKANELVITTALAGEPLRYYVGAAWTRSGQFSSQEEWNAYVASMAARAKSPVRVSVLQP